MNAGTPIRRGVVVGAELAALQAWATEVQSWPAGSHRWGQYAERTAGGDVICRTENVSACHGGFARLSAGPLAQVASAALGEPVVGFKDKINYKQPGGAGFSPHQDLAAYPGASRVMSVLLAIDECTTTSGCLWFAPGVDELLDTDDRGVVVGSVVSSLSWSPAELAPGDALCIAGTTPHYSEANTSAAGAPCARGELCAGGRGLRPRAVLRSAPGADGAGRCGRRPNSASAPWPTSKGSRPRPSPRW